MLRRMDFRNGGLLRVLALAAALGGGGCATGGASGGATAASEAPGTRHPDGGFVTPPSKKKEVMVPGDPASGTTGLGPGAGGLETSTGTAGTRVNPGQTSPGAN